MHQPVELSGQTMPELSSASVEPRRALALFDVLCLTVGVIVGVGVYEAAPQVAKAASSSWEVLGSWVLGGFLTLAGACCYAELAAAFPKDGGDYVYLSRAYGRWAGFLFGWFQCTLIRPGDIAIVSWVAAHHLLLVIDFRDVGLALPTDDPWITALVACLVVTFLTLIHGCGIYSGKCVQNVLTLAKLVGILWLLAAAWMGARHATFPNPPLTDNLVDSTEKLPATVALILVLFTYGGWSDAALIAAEVKRPERNIMRGLVGGSLLVMLLYLVMNGVFLRVLGHPALAQSSAVALDLLRAAGSSGASLWINLLISVSAIGCASGMVLTGARVSYALGADHPGFAWLGHWNARHGAPLRALVVQWLISVAMLLLLRSFLDTLMYTSAAVYASYTATSLSVIVLRRKEPQVPRPYRVSGYPITVWVFAATSLFLTYSALTYRPWHAVAMTIYLAIGLGVYWVQTRIIGRY